MSQYQKIIVRTGNAADVPALSAGELGWDKDEKFFRVGDGLADPPRIVTDKSTGTFDLSNLTSITLPTIELEAGAKVGGVDLSSMLSSTGIVVARASGSFAPVSVVSSNDSLVITNPAGQGGNIDIVLHPNIIANLLATSVLSQVSHDTTMSGDGTAGSPLSVVVGSTTQSGILRLATQTEADTGAITTAALTPSNLANIGGSALTNLTSKIVGNYSISSDATLTGTGQGASPLSVVQATTTQRGALEIATQAEADAGIDTSRALTSAHILNMDVTGANAAAIAEMAYNFSNMAQFNIPTDGSTQVIPGKLLQVSLTPFVNIPTTTDNNGMFRTDLHFEALLDGVWVRLELVGLRRRTGPSQLVYGSQVGYTSDASGGPRNTFQVYVAKTTTGWKVSGPYDVHTGSSFANQFRCRLVATDELGGTTSGGIPVTNTGAGSLCSVQFV